MNSKPINLKENDISMIIGNLPTRLQRKIAEEAGETGKNQHVKKYARKKKTGKDAPDELSRDSKIVLQNKGCSFTLTPRLVTDNLSVSTHGQRSVEALNESKSKLKNGDVTSSAKSKPIPGIIRLKNTELTQRTAAESSKHPKKSREDELEKCNGIALYSPRRARPLELRDEDMMAPSLSRPNSPRIIKTPWLDSLDATVAIKIKTCKNEMMEMMQKNAVFRNWDRFNDVHRILMNIFVQLLNDKLKLCCEYKVDNFFWKLLFYNVREYVERQDQATETAVLMKRFYHEGINFYKDAFKQLSSKYLADETKCVEVGTPNISPIFNDSTDKPSTKKLASVAKVMAQKLLLNLGDLCRYLAKLTKNDLSLATKYYKQAQELIPNNGIPYNQLAVVSIQSFKTFDAIYYHVRSLLASNSIMTAKESLLGMLDDIRRKHDESAETKNTQPTCQGRNKKNCIDKTITQTTRSETWIHPNGERSVYKCNLTKGSLQITDDKFLNAEEINISGMNDDIEIYRSFTSSYLYIIGKLYTGIGMETIDENLKKFLALFMIVLKCDPLMIGRFRYLQMVALNIFVLEHNMQTANRREILSHAFNFSNQYLGIMLRKANDLAGEFIDAKIEDNKSFVDLTTLCQYIRIYSEYLLLHLKEWESGSEKVLTYIDWTSEYTLFSRKIKEMIHSARIKKTYDYDEHDLKIYFEEDNTLVGYTPLGDILPKKICKPSDELKQFWARLHKIIHSYKAFEQYQKRLNAFEENDRILEYLGEKFADDKISQNSLENISTDEEEDEEDGDSSNSSSIRLLSLDLDSPSDGEIVDATVSSKESAQLAMLTKLKRKLEEKSKARKNYNLKLEELIKFVDNQLYLEVRPKYLMPDTNCFIDSLEDFRKLLQEFDHYVLIVPLTVYKELDGLSKGNKAEVTADLPESRKKHYEEVMTNAKSTLDFIKNVKNIRFATSKGSFISDKFFESVQEDSASNDDKILATALSLSQSFSSIDKKDGKCIIHTELVLVTTDRNLRVKAYCNNLAVIDLSNFLKWARAGKARGNGYVL